MFHFYENLIYTSKVLLDKLKVKYSLKNLIFILHSHPNYPSLLSLSDALNEHRIRNKILKVENSKFLNIPRPFVTLIDCDIKEFVVVESIEKNIVNYNLNNKRFSIPIDKFLSIWNNIILVAMPTSLSGDPNYIINNKIDFIHKYKFHLLFVTIVLLIVLNIKFYDFNSINSLIVYSSLVIASFLGILVTILLLWFEIDNSNSTLQKICTGNKNVNCNAVLNSKYSRLFGLVGWSELGFLYFSYSFLFLIIYGNIIINVIGVLVILVFPYFFYSIYYQWKVIKQWCILCLLVQAIW